MLLRQAREVLSRMKKKRNILMKSYDILYSDYKMSNEPEIKEHIESIEKTVQILNRRISEWESDIALTEMEVILKSYKG